MLSVIDGAGQRAVVAEGLLHSSLALTGSRS